MSVHTSYTASSLADIAAGFRAKAKQAETMANWPGRTKSEYLGWLREANTWLAAAVILENTTLTGGQDGPQ